MLLSVFLGFVVFPKNQNKPQAHKSEIIQKPTFCISHAFMCKLIEHVFCVSWHCCLALFCQGYKNQPRGNFNNWHLTWICYSKSHFCKPPKTIKCKTTESKNTKTITNTKQIPNPKSQTQNSKPQTLNVVP